MAYYIDREAVLKIVNKLDDMTALVVGRKVMNLPAADVAPVWHGRWEWREEWDVDVPNQNSTLESCGWYCTNCGIELGEYQSQTTGEKHYLDDDFFQPKLTFCPACGVKMKLEEEDG